jgi:hypothetical protein
MRKHDQRQRRAAAIVRNEHIQALPRVVTVRKIAFDAKTGIRLALV